MARAKLERTGSGWIGQVFSGRYRVVDCLGQGALGSVYLVEHVQVGRRFAMKVLREEHQGSKAIVERFRQEAKLGGRLQDANTVQVVDYDTWQGAPYLVMEYLEGENLSRLLRREGPLPALRAARLLVQACRGTSAAHALGILHRDLKPSNLFVTRLGNEEVCKVLDFGVAKAEASLIATSVAPSTSTGAIIGTLAYMAPEQIRADGDMDVRADVYALGAILYECLAGARPFDAPTPPTLMYKILEEQPRALGELRPDLPESLVASVHRALARDRDARFQSARELELCLERFLSGGARSSMAHADATEAGTESLTGPVRSAEPQRAVSARPRRLSGKVVAPLALALGSAALGAGIGFDMGRDVPPPPNIPPSLAAAPIARSTAALLPSPAPKAPEPEEVGPTPIASATPVPIASAPPLAPNAISGITAPARSAKKPKPKPKPKLQPEPQLQPEPMKSKPAPERDNDFERANPYRGVP